MRKAFHVAAFMGAFTFCLLAERSPADSVTLYTNAAQFAANTAGVSTIGFEGLAAANSNTSYNGGGGQLKFPAVTFYGSQTVLVNGVQNSAPNADLYVADAGYGGGAYTLDSGAALYGGYGYNDGTTVWRGDLQANVSQTATAVGFQLGLAGHGSTSYVVDAYTASMGYSYTVLIPAGADGSFVGFTADAPIVEVLVLNNYFGEYSLGQGEHIVLDNFQTGTFAPAVSAAPLPSSAYASLALLGGMGLLTWARRRNAE